MEAQYVTPTIPSWALTLNHISLTHGLLLRQSRLNSMTINVMDKEKSLSHNKQFTATAVGTRGGGGAG